MKDHPFHTAMAAVTLCVMLLTSTGFTAIVKYCTMSESSAACCCGETHDTAPASDRGLALTAPEASCDVQVVAGGRNEIDATVHTAAAVELPVMDCILPDCAALRADASRSVAMHRSDAYASPPGVDIYILVNSFLI